MLDDDWFSISFCVYLFPVFILFCQFN
jgi:hypothetical protein